MDAKHEAAGLKARLKELDGGKLTTRERSALDRWRRESIEDARDAFLTEVPKGLYCKLAGRQHKVVDEFGTRYDIAVDMPVIDLSIVIEQLHSRVSELAAAARPNMEGDEAELVREKLRQEIGKLQRQSATLQIELDKHMDKLLAKGDVAVGMDWLSDRLRGLGSHLYRVCGQEAVDAVNEFLEAMAVELEAGTLRF